MAKDSSRNPNPLAHTVDAMNTMPIARPRVAQVQRGMSVKKKGPLGGGEPATANHPRQVMERMGAKRRIEVKLPGAQSPEAGATQANGRTVRSVMGSRGNFQDQASQRW